MSEQPAFVKGIVEAIKHASDSIHHSPDWWDSSYSDDGMREIDYIEAEIFDQVHKYTAERDARIRELEREVGRLKSVVAKLPKTHEGIPVVRGETYWYVDPCGFVQGIICRAWYFVTTSSVPDICYAEGRVYSTREAAEAARKEQTAAEAAGGE